jgi:beta-glucanase (GH16 family)
MKTQKTFIIALLALSVLSACTKKEEPEPSTLHCKSIGFTYTLESLTYDLVWSDEFDGTEVNLDNWSYETGASGWGNNELQYYTNGLNSSVKDGFLTIEIRKESYEGASYTSSRMVSRQKADFTYGKFEVRAKMPQLLGSWSAIWMMPTSSSSYGAWPNSGEIDIMESVGYVPNTMYGTVHTSSFNHKKGTQKGFTLPNINVADEYHIYTVEWLPDQIRFSVDGVFKYRFKPGLYLDCPTYSQWPFDKNFFMILNTAVGGSWGGAKGVSETGWPISMSVDYVRVYQAKEMPAIIASKK